MSFFNSLMKKLYNLGPLFSLRRGVRDKLDRFFDEKNRQLIEPVNKQFRDINVRFSQQVEDISKKHVQQTDLLHELKNRLQVALNKIDAVAVRQEHVANYYGYFGIEDDFSKAVCKVLAGDYQTIPQFNSLILVELLKGYMDQGGIWRLKDEVNFVLAPGEPVSRILDLEKTALAVEPKPLKILIVSGMFPNIYHGGGLRLVDIITELSKNNSVDLYTIYDEDLDRDSLEIVKEKIDSIKLVKYNEISMQSIESWLAELHRERGYYDVIQCEYPHSIRYIENLKKYGRKVGFTFMECLAKSYIIKLYNIIENKEFSMISEYVKFFWRYIVDEKYALEQADFTIAMTPEDSEILQRLSPVESYIVPTCVSTFAVLDEVEKYKDVMAEEKSVAFLGYYGHYPNVDSMKWYFREIHPLVKQRIPDYKFYVIGRGDTSDLEALVAGDESVVFTGTVDNLVPHLRKAKVCVLPLVTGAGVRGKLNQYSVAGRPSVSTTIGNKGLQYVHEENILIADDAAAFAQSIIKLLTDQVFCEKIGTNAAEYAMNNFTWKNHIANVLKIYHSG